jgi:hypothetical protein
MLQLNPQFNHHAALFNPQRLVTFDAFTALIYNCDAYRIVVLAD